ncbi:MAG: undecaprenyldiphospho-muramoylpentapeptide beta-N-acetylglucosaminyltransferase [Patescibacteria group bacterium]
MKIILTGGGTGGHFYPILAVIDAINMLAEQKKMLPPEIVFMSDSPYDSAELVKRGVRFKRIYAGKIRRYFSLRNFPDILKTLAGIIKAVVIVYLDFPDIIFSKGGYVSFPVIFAAKIFGMPLVIHESDAVPGKVNQWAGKFARGIAISFPQTIKYFPKEKTAYTGNPIRKGFSVPLKTGSREILKLEENLPVILVLGGSQGARAINDLILDVLPELIQKYQIIHQCGENNFEDVKKRISIILDKSSLSHRYHLFKYLKEDLLRMAYGSANLVISRAGSGSIFEIATSGLPSILIPLPHAAQDHQRENAQAYAETGATEIIEQNNLTPHILLSEIEKIISNKKLMEDMSKTAKNFSKPDAAEKIAKEILVITLEHS